CHGLFIEVDNPDRAPPEFLDAERVTALDAHERLRLFAHLGFKHVELRYVQPPLAPGKAAVDYLDLLFAPWTSDATNTLPASWVLQTVEPIWRAWAPATYSAELERLRADLARGGVRLLNIGEVQ